MLEQLIRRFYPVPHPSEDERERAGLLITLSLGGVAMSGLSSLAMALHGDSPLKLASNAFGIGFCALVLASLRRWKSVPLSATLVSVAMTVTQVAAAFSYRDLSHLAWMLFVPVVMVLLTDARRGLAWFGVCVSLALATAYWLRNDGGAIAVHDTADLTIKALTFGTCTFGFTILFALSRNRTLRSLEAVRDEATRANALKSQFLASFSHEIRTPLNGVLGTTDLLLSGELSDEVREQLQVIQRSGSSLLRTINDVLELSRIEAGRLELFPVATDLPRLLEDVTALFRARAQSNGVALSIELERGHPCSVTVDDLRLRQVLQNLVGNAVKFTTSGSVRVRLWPADAKGDLARLHITVEDTGPGIAPEAMKRLFTAFTQARAQVDREEGSGLGLAISKQFVELMGGTLSVSSELGRGTTFTLRLEVPVAARVVATDAPLPFEAAAEQSLRVLVVDDNEINLRVAASLLMRLGHEVQVARDGEQCLAAVPVHQPDVIFMDCHMPVLDGLEATKRLRASGDGRPVVALTASVYAEDRARCLEAGMNFFVSKPVTLAALQAALVEVAGAAKPKDLVREKRVLVVDDDPHVRNMTVRLLRSEGFEVSDAADLEAAQILYERANPDWVLVDQVLGGEEDGIHFAERLCRQRRGLGVVLTSGHLPTPDQLDALKAIGGRFLPKPYSLQTLMTLIG
jgi:signal transduction histidine kinase/DNA-binding response OmpR family regulator